MREEESQSYFPGESVTLKMEVNLDSTYVDVLTGKEVSGTVSIERFGVRILSRSHPKS